MNLLNSKPGRGIPLVFVAATSLTLFGCGGEDSSTSVSPGTQSATLSAQDATYSTGYAELFEVDLSSKVFSSTGGGFELSQVEVLSSDDSCQVESMTETGFVILASDTKVCNYRYHVTPKTSSPMSQMSEAPTRMSDNSNSEGSTSALTRVAVSSDPSSTELVPISTATLIDEDVSVSLKTELDKVGFTLSDEFVLTEATLPYGRGSSVQINPLDNQVLDYTPPVGFAGIDRVLYTLEDSANGLVLMGVLDIAVSYEANQGFTIDDNIEYPEVVDVFTEIEIDISNFVSSEDDDDYQLVYVETFQAEATSKDPLDTINKIILFEASEPGYHYISFAVSDHNGVYDMGLIRVEVTDPNQSAKWDDIPHLLDVYTAPPTALDAAGEGVPYDMKLTDGMYSPAIDMAGVRYPSAVSYCDTIGAVLPTVDELTQMGLANDVQLLHNWPTQAKYLAYDNVASEPMAVELTDGSTSTEIVDPTSAYYVTCVKQGLIDVLPTSSTQAVADGVDVASVFVELKLGEEVRPDTIVTASVSSSFVTLDSDTLTTNSNGIAEFRLTSIKAETVTLTLDVNDITQDYQVKFIGDEKSAGVTSETTINNAAYASADGNQVTATLKDAYDNPVEGFSVTSEVSSGVHPDTSETVKPLLVEETTETDAQGQQKVRVKWDSQYETPKTNMTFDVTSSYTTTVNKQTESTSEVTFNAYLCGGQVGDDDMTNAAGDCIKMAESGGKLYTGNPSVSFLEAIDYDGYRQTQTETGTSGPSGLFGRFDQSEAIQLCTQYNTIELYGRSNWRLGTESELLSLYNELGDMFEKGWATYFSYRTSTFGYNYNLVGLDDGKTYGGNGEEYPVYGTCLSDSDS
ncbi:Ig-like domain-containing protein [Vibrio pomeroyi]|uniref:Ig-like domain-containing protein n=1 Tax=Vibrio pomeroyi TaxID=198832 RepID=UPI0035A6CB7C